MFAGVILAVWVIALGADVFVEGYSPPQSVHAALLLVAGAIFGVQAVRR